MYCVEPSGVTLWRRSLISRKAFSNGSRSFNSSRLLSDCAGGLVACLKPWIGRPESLMAFLTSSMACSISFDWRLLSAAADNDAFTPLPILVLTSANALSISSLSRSSCCSLFCLFIGRSLQLSAKAFLLTFESVLDVLFQRLSQCELAFGKRARSSHVGQLLIPQAMPGPRSSRATHRLFVSCCGTRQRRRSAYD